MVKILDYGIDLEGMLNPRYSKRMHGLLKQAVAALELIIACGLTLL